MTDLVRPRVKYVIGPDGSPLTIADLPPSNTRRWVIRRKAEVVAAVRGGLLSLEEACQRYKLTTEEFLSWQASIDEYGLAGLRTTRIQQATRSAKGAHRCAFFLALSSVWTLALGGIREIAAAAAEAGIGAGWGRWEIRPAPRTSGVVSHPSSPG
jgi:hypothetical protein